MGDKSAIPLEQRDEQRWEIPRHGAMRVPGIIYASAELMRDIVEDEALAQVRNVACLPGILRAAIAMPDIHQGYGFPIGGVAAMDPVDGVVSPGGVGYDINCGVRVVATRLDEEDVRPRLERVVAAIYERVPCGVGRGSGTGRALSRGEARAVMEHGVRWALDAGYHVGLGGDAAHVEEGGCLASADADAVSDTALERGREQLGSLGSGNHFFEVDVVDEVYAPEVADAFGLSRGQVLLQIHSGSRGLGHQVCDDALEEMQGAMARHRLSVPDRQLACVPIRSAEGERYLGAMAAAANFAFANRQVLAALGVRALGDVLGASEADVGARVLYDVCHNIAKHETHSVDGRPRRVLVHRKGATRAFPAGHDQVPDVFRSVGQPVLVPGDMGTASFILVGTERALDETFGTACHGAGRVMSRARAMRETKGRSLARELAERGIVVRARGRDTLNEEAPEAYKRVGDVADVLARAGLARKVARLRPIGCVKG